jgi:hypothetical protein
VYLLLVSVAALYLSGKSIRVSRTVRCHHLLLISVSRSSPWASVSLANIL